MPSSHSRTLVQFVLWGDRRSHQGDLRGVPARTAPAAESSGAGTQAPGPSENGAHPGGAYESI